VKIRSHLLVLLAGAFLPLMVFAVAITSFSWWQQRKDLELRYLERVRAMTIALDTEIDGGIRMLRALGLSVEQGEARHAFLDRMRRTLDTQPMWSAVAAGDPSWKHVQVAWREPGGSPLPAIDPQALASAEAKRLPAVSGLVRAPDGQYVTEIIVPVMRGHAIESILVAVVEQSAWLRFMSQYPIGNGATMAMVDQHGEVIARTQDNALWVGKAPPALLLEKSREMAEGAYRGRGADGDPVYAAHSRSLRWGWTVGTSVPAEIIEAALLDSSALLAAAAFVSIGLAVLFAFLLSRRIQRPITALGASARALAHGEPQPPHPPSSIDEVEEVQGAFGEADAMLRERQQRLNEALAAEREARREAEQASRAKDEFLAMLGHELRNPLNAIASAVSVLHYVDPKSGEALRARDIIDRQMVSLRQLVDDLLDVARVTRGRIMLNTRPLDLAAVARRTVTMMSASGRLARHRVETDFREAWIVGDETRMEQVVTNLVDNAAKYTQEGGTIFVRARPEGNEAVLEVQDNGMGIAPALLPRIFELFTQGERTIDRSQGGLGLGLSLVRRLAEMHGGSIRAHSAGTGQGATFTVRIPLAPVPAEARAPRTAAAEAEREKPLNILVVEDNDDGRETLAMMLRLNGHQVHEADSGPGGVASLKAVHPDVAIVDIGLPGFDGYEVARRARAAPETRGVRLVALTGYGQEEDRRNARAAGFDWFLVKPADMGAIAEILGHL
jgi:signal transduction histidine kinase/CheY-like chemotaxis protein